MTEADDDDLTTTTSADYELTTEEPLYDYEDTSNRTSNSSFIEQRCFDNKLSEDGSDTAKILMYVSGGWIILWCIITILVNLCHKNKGHQRTIHFLEEFVIILFSISTYILNFVFSRNLDVCKYISISIHYIMVLLASLFLMESFFASSMVHAKSNKNGKVPRIFNILIPIGLAVIPTVATYFADNTYYGISGVHCFVISTVDTFWGFVMPVWLIVSITALKSQLACIACDKQTDEQDIEQCYWARRSVKCLVLLTHYIFSLWLLVLFTGEHQRIYLFIVTLVLSVIFGPFIFVCHTYCHLNTCKKWSGSGCFSQLYAMCPPKPIKSDNKEEEEEKEKEKEPIEEMEEGKEEADPLPEKKEETGKIPYGNENQDTLQPPSVTHTDSNNFYSWLTSPNEHLNSGDVLFNQDIY